MKIWRIYPHERYGELAMKEIDLDYLHSFDGRSKKEGWAPPETMPYDRCKLGNITDFEGILTLDKIALESLKDLIGNNAEILPIYYNDKEFYLINVIKFVDVINFEKSKYKSLSNGKIVVFDNYVLDKTMIADNDIFKMKGDAPIVDVVSDRFKQRVEEKRLTGVGFRLVWDSEAQE